MIAKKGSCDRVRVTRGVTGSLCTRRGAARWSIIRLGRASHLTGASQLGYYVSGGNRIIRASNDADAAAEVEIQLIGVKRLTAGDFRF